MLSREHHVRRQGALVCKICTNLSILEISLALSGAVRRQAGMRGSRGTRAFFECFSDVGILVTNMLLAPIRLWCRYWFSRPARYSLGIARITIAASVLLALHCHVFPSYANCVGPSRAALYQPEGVLHLFGPNRPPLWVFERRVMWPSSARGRP